jgi:hypothetical protein
MASGGAVAQPAAQRLHDLLEQIRGVGGRSLREAWETALEAEYGSAEFAERHAMVVSLLTETISSLRGLSNQAQERARRYIPAWWAAVVNADQQWGAQGQNLQTLMPQSDLDHLGNVAGLIAERFGRAEFPPVANALAELDAECLSWLEQLRKDTDVPRPVANALIADFEHARWLIANHAAFGEQPIVRQTQSMLAAVATATSQVPVAKQGAWKGKAASLALVVGTLSGLLQLPSQALESGRAVAEITDAISSGSEDAEAPALRNRASVDGEVADRGVP